MKEPNWKVPLVLASSLLVLGSFAYWLKFSHQPKADRADLADKKPIMIPEDAQIQQIRIKGASTVIEIRCNSMAQKTCKPGAGGDWTITYPGTFKADSDAVKDALNTANTMMASDVIDLKEETPEKRTKLIDEYGLSPDKRTKLGSEFLEVTLENGKKLAAFFGETYPMGDKLFVGSTQDGTLNEKTIFVVASFYKKIFDKTVTNFRDKTVLTFNRADIENFTAKTSSGSIDAQLVNGAWVLNGKRGDFDRVSTLLNSISQLKARDFPGEEPLKKSKSIAKFDLKSKTASYTLELFDKQLKPIKIPGHPEVPGEEHFYVRSSDLKEPAEVEATARGQLDKSLSDLRYALVLGEAEKAIDTHFKVEGSTFSPPADFKFDGKAWAQTSGTKMDATKVGALLTDFANNRATSFLTPAPATPANAITISIGDDKNASKTHFAIFEAKNAIYAKDLNDKSNEAMVLHPTLKAALPFTPDSWKAK